MKIATFNINGIKARLPRLVEWLEETQPDIACLQELKSSDETMPTKEIEAAGSGFLYHGQKRSEEHTAELQSLMRKSDALFCLKKKNHTTYLKKPKTHHNKIKLN